MKTILTICLICFALSATVISDDKKGPAYNPKHPQADRFCDGGAPSGVSDCVDSLLWNEDRNRYADRCCYMRFQKDGEMFATCVGLTEEQYMDISETIRRFEEGDKLLKKYFSKDNLLYDEEDNFVNSKIYQLDCASSYLKFLSFAIALFALLL